MARLLCQRSHCSAAQARRWAIAAGRCSYALMAGTSRVWASTVRLACVGRVIELGGVMQLAQRGCASSDGERPGRFGAWPVECAAVHAAWACQSTFCRVQRSPCDWAPARRSTPSLWRWQPGTCLCASWTGGRSPWVRWPPARLRTLRACVLPVLCWSALHAQHAGTAVLGVPGCPPCTALGELRARTERSGQHQGEAASCRLRSAAWPLQPQAWSATASPQPLCCTPAEHLAQASPVLTTRGSGTCALAPQPAPITLWPAAGAQRDAADRPAAGTALPGEVLKLWPPHFYAGACLWVQCSGFRGCLGRYRSWSLVSLSGVIRPLEPCPERMHACHDSAAEGLRHALRGRSCVVHTRRPQVASPVSVFSGSATSPRARRRGLARERHARLSRPEHSHVSQRLRLTASGIWVCQIGAQAHSPPCVQRRAHARAPRTSASAGPARGCWRPTMQTRCAPAGVLWGSSLLCCATVRCGMLGDVRGEPGSAAAPWWPKALCKRRAWSGLKFCWVQGSVLVLCIMNCEEGWMPDASSTGGCFACCLSLAGLGPGGHWALVAAAAACTPLGGQQSLLPHAECCPQLPRGGAAIRGGHSRCSLRALARLSQWAIASARYALAHAWVRPGHGTLRQTGQGAQTAPAAGNKTGCAAPNEVQVAASLQQHALLWPWSPAGRAGAAGARTGRGTLRQTGKADCRLHGPSALAALTPSSSAQVYCWDVSSAEVRPRQGYHTWRGQQGAAQQLQRAKGDGCHAARTHRQRCKRPAAVQVTPVPLAASKVLRAAGPAKPGAQGMPAAAAHWEARLPHIWTHPEEQAAMLVASRAAGATYPEP